MSYGLIADIGATNARFALADKAGIYDPQTLACADYPTVVEAARTYLDATAKTTGGAPITRASFAIAGPVNGDIFRMTNHGWTFSQEETRKALSLDSFHLMNDFEAVALAVPHLRDEDLQKIGGRNAIPHAPIAILGPGTGLGVASLFWDGQKYRPNPCEGGHVTIPVKTRREFDVIQVLQNKYSHVSAERVCSGKGLVNIYNALRELENNTAHAPERTPAEISQAAIAQTCPISVESLQMMLGFLGTTAGNLALSLGSFGGVYIAGGIPAKLGPAFQDSPFYDQFLSKGRFRDYLSPIPVSLITHPYIAFVGLQADLFAQS